MKGTKKPTPTPMVGGYPRHWRGLPKDCCPQPSVAEQRGTYSWNLKKAVLSRKRSRERNVSPKKEGKMILAKAVGSSFLLLGLCFAALPGFA
jgi:hypothetical protein